MGHHTLPEDLDLSSDVEDLKEILTTVEPRLQPIPQIRSHVSRFVDGADMDEVYPKLWLGDCDAATNIPYLKKNRITHILNAADNKTGPARVKTGKDFYKDTKFIYKGLDLIDLPFANVAKFFDESAYFINEALLYGGTVLVHCRQGKSRSASIVIAFLMLRRNYTAARALRRLKEIRDIRPNNSFLQQIADLDLALFRKRLELHISKLSSLSDSDSDDSDSQKGQSGGASSLNSKSSSTGQTQLNGHFYSCSEYSTEASICLVRQYDDSDDDSDAESGERTPKYSEVTLENKNGDDVNYSDVKCLEKTPLKHADAESDGESLKENRTFKNEDVEVPRKMSLKFAAVESDIGVTEEMAYQNSEELDSESVENLDKWALKFAEFQSNLEEREMLECSQVEAPDGETVLKHVDLEAANVEGIGIELECMDEEFDSKILKEKLECSEVEIESIDKTLFKCGDVKVANIESIDGKFLCVDEDSDSDNKIVINVPLVDGKFLCVDEDSDSGNQIVINVPLENTLVKSDFENEDTVGQIIKTDAESIEETICKYADVKPKSEILRKAVDAKSIIITNLDEPTDVASDDNKSNFKTKAITKDVKLKFDNEENKEKKEKSTLKFAGATPQSKVERGITIKKRIDLDVKDTCTAIASSDYQPNFNSKTIGIALDDSNRVPEIDAIAELTLENDDMKPKCESVVSNSKLDRVITHKKLAKGIKGNKRTASASNFDVQSTFERKAIIIEDLNTVSMNAVIEESIFKNTDIAPKFENGGNSTLTCAGDVDTNTKLEMYNKLNKDTKCIKETALASSDVQTNFEIKEIKLALDDSNIVSDIEFMEESMLKSTDLEPKLKGEKKSTLERDVAVAVSNSKIEDEVTYKTFDKGVNVLNKTALVRSDVQSRFESNEMALDDSNTVASCEVIQDLMLKTADVKPKFECSEKSTVECAGAVSKSKLQGETSHKKLAKGVKGIKKTALSSSQVLSNFESKAISIDSKIESVIESMEESKPEDADVQLKFESDVKLTVKGADPVSNSKFEGETTHKKLVKGVKGIKKTALGSFDIQSSVESEIKVTDDSTYKSSAVKPKFKNGETTTSVTKSKFIRETTYKKTDQDDKPI